MCLLLVPFSLDLIAYVLLSLIFKSYTLKDGLYSAQSNDYMRKPSIGTFENRIRLSVPVLFITTRK